MSDTLSYVIGIVGLLGVIFTVYSYFREPDIESQRTDALLAQRLEMIEKRLTNDLPHIDSQIKDIHGDLSSVKQDIVRLSTVIEERIPRKRK